MMVSNVRWRVISCE